MKSYSRSVRWRVSAGEQRLILLLGDAILAILALFIALYVWAEGDQWLKEFSLDFLNARVPFWYYLIPIAWLLMLVELYDTSRARRRKDTLYGIGVATLISLAIYLVIYFLSDPETIPRKGVAIFIGVVAVLTILWRMFYIRLFTAPQFMRRVLIVGAGKSGRALLEILRDIWPQPFYLVGLIDDDPQKIGQTIENHPILGGNDSLVNIIRKENISDLILAISGEMNGNMFQSLLDAQENGVDITTMPVIYEELLGRVPISLLETDWIVHSFVDQARSGAFYELGKRFLDVLGGLIGCLFLAVIIPTVGLATLIDSGFPVFYLQNRLGRRGKVYKIIKFRTMKVDAEKDGIARVTTRHDERITHVGWLLRKTHIDEWPQFINILKGEMSLVGPRAERLELVQELQKKIPFYRARLLVKPGLTGWAQVNFGYAATVEDTAIKLEYDLYYIKHRSLVMDFIILLRTFGSVVGLRGQ
jgi:exopolysaccharide biosynthesis polyprenyl glycosylphosphotransferase